MGWTISLRNGNEWKQLLFVGDTEMEGIRETRATYRTNMDQKTMLR